LLFPSSRGKSEANKEKSARIAEEKQRFPLLAGATPFRVTLRRGSCLYLPASWFHCVSSFGDDDDDDDDKVNSSSLHIALNYWVIVIFQYACTYW
jgi:hypothetical protein